MGTLTADFEAGAQGATVSVSDAGSASPFDIVNLGANSSIRYDGLAYKGSRSMRIVSGTAGGAYTTTLGWQSPSVGSVTDHWGRLYIYLDNPFKGDRFWQNRTTAGAQAGALNIQPGQNVIIQDAALSIVATGAKTLVTKRWHRIEWHFVHSTTVGTALCELYLGDNVEGTVPDETLSASGLNLAANAIEMLWGLGDNDSDINVLFDQVVANSTTRVGPVGLSSSFQAPRVFPQSKIGPF